MNISPTINNPTQTQLIHYTQLKDYGYLMNAPMSEPEFYEDLMKRENAVYDLINAKMKIPIFGEICKHMLPTVKRGLVG